MSNFETREHNDIERIIRGLLLVGLAAGVAAGSSACGGGADPGPGGTSCTDIADQPDILGQITYTPSTVAVGDTVTLHIPIDAITAHVGVELAGYNGQTPVGHSVEGMADGTGYVTVASPGVQTLDLTMTIDPASAAGSYIPVINLCTVDLAACRMVGGASGVAVNYAPNIVSLESPLQRFEYFANGTQIDPAIGNLPVDSCVDTPVLTVGS